MMDRTGIARWLLVATVIAIGCDVIKADPACWDFNLGDSGWTNVLTNPLDWKFSTINGDADDSSIPSFYYSTPYLYYQDQSTPPVTGSVYSPNIILQDGDQVTMVVFRHIIDSYLNDSSRPQLRFDDGQVSRNIEFSFNYDRWDTVTATCGTGYTICCTAYPCPGKFFLDGVAYIRDELIAVDSIEVAGGCSGSPTAAPTTAPPTPPPTAAPTTAPPTAAPTTAPPTAAPTTAPPTAPPTTAPPTAPPTPPPTTTPPTPPPTTRPPTPASWCCAFSSSVCGWSPAYVSNGWYWSTLLPPPPGFIPASGDNGYVYAIDETTELSSPSVTDMPTSATFSFTYYLATSSYATSYMTFTFTNQYGEVTASGYFLPTGSSWQTEVFGCMGDCCSNTAGNTGPCSGTVTIQTYNKPGDKLEAAIDSFSVDSTPC